MRIAELVAFHVAIPLKRSIRHASHARTSTDNIVVRCVLADGTAGYGEGVPRDYVTGETIASSIALLKQTNWSGQLEDCRDFAHAVAMAERLQLPEVPGDERGCQSNAARCAVELAVLDAYGRRFGEALWAVTRHVAPELFFNVPEVRYSGIITSSQGLRARGIAWAMRLLGFRQIKVKVGIPGQDDVKRLAVIRRAAGSAIDLRIDANEAWDFDEAVGRLQALYPFRLSSVEQPLPHSQAHRFGELRRAVKIPVMLDESLCSRRDAQRAIDLTACDSFNLRLSKCGGFIASLRLMQLAMAQGISCQLGCQVGESAILSAAGRHFATSVKGLKYLEGSYDGYLVKESLSPIDLTFRRGGWAPALIGPGLGIDIDEEALVRVTRSKEVLLG